MFGPWNSGRIYVAGICWHEPPGSPKTSQGAIGQSANVSHHLIRPTGWGPAGHVTCSELFIRQCSFECGYMVNICTYLLYPNILIIYAYVYFKDAIYQMYLVLSHLASSHPISPNTSWQAALVMWAANSTVAVVLPGPNLLGMANIVAWVKSGVPMGPEILPHGRSLWKSQVNHL